VKKLASWVDLLLEVDYFWRWNTFWKDVLIKVKLVFLDVRKNLLRLVGVLFVASFFILECRL
jgi:hypothetical protein